MTAAEKSIAKGEPTAGDAVPETIICAGCEQPIAKDAPHCPYCCGEDGRLGEVKRGAFLGAVFGLLGGSLLVAVWSSIVGPEQATWGPVLSIVLAGAVTGMIVGALRSRMG